MFICLDCGHVFNEDELASWEEGRGEYWGEPCSEEVSGCPQCKGDYAKTYRCNSCDEWIDDIYIKTDDGNRYCLECYKVMHIGDED